MVFLRELSVIYDFLGVYFLGFVADFWFLGGFSGNSLLFMIFGAGFFLLFLSIF